MARPLTRPMTFHVSTYPVGRLQGYAVALAQVGDEVPVVYGRDTKLGGSSAGFGNESLDFGQQGLGGLGHAGDMMGNYPSVNAGLGPRRPDASV